MGKNHLRHVGFRKLPPWRNTTGGASSKPKERTWASPYRVETFLLSWPIPKPDSASWTWWRSDRSSDNRRCDCEVYEDREQVLYDGRQGAAAERRVLTEAAYRPRQHHGDERCHGARRKQRERDGDRHVGVPQPSK